MLAIATLTMTSADEVKGPKMAPLLCNSLGMGAAHFGPSPFQSPGKIHKACSNAHLLYLAITKQQSFFSRALLVFLSYPCSTPC